MLTNKDNLMFMKKNKTKQFHLVIVKKKNQYFHKYAQSHDIVFIEMYRKKWDYLQEKFTSQ